MSDTLDAALGRLRERPKSERYFFQLALLHEDMHGEALLMTLQTLGLPAPPIEVCGAMPCAAEASRDIDFAGGEFVQGTGRADFIFDNERAAHRVAVAPFSMASHPVTQGEFAAFVDDVSARAPVYWNRDGSNWLARRFDRWDRDRSRRADGARVAAGSAGLLRVGGPQVAHGSRMGIRGAPRRRSARADDRRRVGMDLERLRALSGLQRPIRTASTPSPGSTRITCCAAAASPRRRASPTSRFRNFYLPERSDMFAGFRTCALEAR